MVPAFCRAAAEGLDIRVDGRENLFDCTYIDDVVSGMVAYISALVKSPIPLPPIHFTTGKATSLGEIASYAKEISSHKIEIREAPSRSFDVSTFCGDASQAKELLKWEARIDLKEGMNRLIQQFELFSEVNKALYA